MADERQSAVYVTCRGTGISVPLSKNPPSRCVVEIPARKESVLCAFCERTEKRFR